MKSLAPPYQNVVSVAYKPSSVIGGHLSRPIVTDGFKRNPESIDGPSQSLFRFLLRAGFTSRTSRQAAGELLPHLSTLTRQACGISLLHFPWGRPRRTLSGTLPCGARTFLMRMTENSVPHATAWLTHKLYKLFYAYSILPQFSHSTMPSPVATRLTVLVGSDMLQPEHWLFSTFAIGTA